MTAPATPAARAALGRVVVTIDGAEHVLDVDTAHLLIDRVRDAIREVHTTGGPAAD